MSEKHLTELAWRNVAKEHEIKETTLQKALGKFSLCKEDDREGRLEALDEIRNCANKLKLANRSNTEVAAYLGEVYKEADKTYKALELPRKGPVAKEQPKPTPKIEEKADEEAEADLKARLTNSLRNIKAAEGSESFAFLACVARPFYGVLLGKNATETLGQTHKTILSDLTAGTKFIAGRCMFEKNAHTFITDPVPGGLAKILKAALHHFTDSSYKVRVRDPEGKVVDDSDTAIDETIESLKQQFNTDLVPLVRQMMAANPNREDEIRAAVTLLNDKFKGGTVPEASEALKKVASLVEDLQAMAPLKEQYEKIKPRVKELFEQNPTRSEEIKQAVTLLNQKFESGTSAEVSQALTGLESLLAAVAWPKRFDTVDKKYQASLKTQPANASELRAVMASVNASVKNADFIKAGELLTRLEGLLKAATTMGKEIDVIPQGMVDPTGAESIVSLKEKFQKLKAVVKGMSEANPTRSKEIDSAVNLLNEKLESTNVLEASAALKSLAILLKSLPVRTGSVSASTPQGSSVGAQPKQPTPPQQPTTPRQPQPKPQPTTPQPTPQQPTPQQQQPTAQPMEEDRKLREETQGLITVLSYQDKLLPAPLLDFLTKLPSKNKEIDNVTDVTKRCNQRRSLRDQLLEVQNGIADYIKTHERTTRAYTTATKGLRPQETGLERKIYNKLAERLEAHNALDISKSFEDIRKLDREFAEFNRNKTNLAATYQKAKSLCEKISKALPLRKKEFDEKLESGSVTDLAALVSELEKLDNEGPEEARKAMDIVTKTSDQDLNSMDVTKRIELLTNLRRGPVNQKGVLQKARNRLYKAMEMDKDFEQTDKKMREEVLNNVEKLIKSTDAKQKWPTMNDKQKEGFLQKVLEIQCAEMKNQMPNFEAPKITTFSEAAAEVEKDKLTTESGYFKGGKIYINDKKESFKDFADVINTVIHENTHNYQDQLVGMLERGELENDPRKNQAILFRLNEGEYQDSPKRDNYKGKDSEYDEAFDAYEKQPRELHAMRAGNDAKARFQG